MTVSSTLPSRPGTAPAARPGPLGRLARNIFYLLFRLTSEIELPTEAGDFRLMDSAVVRAIAGGGTAGGPSSGWWSPPRRGVGE